jgi:hypothetical protein
MAFKLNIKQINEDAEEYSRRAARRNQRDIAFYDLKRGSHTLRFLPIGPDEETCYIPKARLAMPVYTHYFQSDKSDKVRCIERTFPERDETCPICVAERELREWAKGQDLPKTEYDKLFSGFYRTGKAYTNCIDRNGPLDTVVFEGEEIQIPRVYVLGIPMKLFNEINNAIAQGIEEDVTDEMTGSDYIMTIAGAGLHTEYTGGFKKKTSALHDDPKVRKAILANMWNIGEIFTSPNKAQLDKAAVLADKKIRGLMTPLPEKNPTGTETNTKGMSKPTPEGKRLSARPDCYGNHIVGFGRCLPCAWEDACREESDPALSEAERRVNHEKLAVERASY